MAGLGRRFRWARYGRFCASVGLAVVVSSLLFPAAAWAACSSTQIPDCRPCRKPVCLFDGDTSRWVCQADSTKNGVSCTDNNACTTGDVCSDGACVGTPVTCPSDQCNNPGTCNTATGACSS